MAIIRAVDPDATASGQRIQTLLDQEDGPDQLSLLHIETPPGGGSSAGLHTHPVDQIFYVLGGTMTVEVDGDVTEAGPGTLVVFPANTPHRNWNAGPVPTVHLAINTPPPDPDAPFANPV